MPIDLLNFVRKWNASILTERSAAPQHFRDLCEVLDEPHPTQTDEIGASYTYEKRVAKAGSGEEGFADVWKRGFFAWEYKSKGGDLKKAYKQLNEYHEALDNPPILVVCDFVRFEVHTKFENASTRVFAFTLDDLLNDKDTATCALPPLQVLRYVFGDFNQLRPEVVAIPVTKAAAEDFLKLAQRLEIERALSPERPTKEQIAHFLMRLVFCLFADSVELLPDSTFRRLVRNHRHSPISFNRALPELFLAMSQRDSFFGPVNIPYFNGGLFKEDDVTIPLDHADLGILNSAASHDWSHIEPAIFGTLFERSLDSAKRSMIGAHYTSPEDIALLVDPVVMAPLKRRWEAVRLAALQALAEEAAPPSSEGVILTRNEVESQNLGSLLPPAPKPRRVQPSLRANRPALTILQNWADELSRVRILDPACGSGNFLYIALKKLLDLWQQARIFAIEQALTLAPEPLPSPTQLFGIEVDFYAHEIASIVVWIGFLQWKRDHGEARGEEPILHPLTNIQHDDAILRYDADNKSPEHPNGKPYEPTWPEADFIVGNPPFLGDKKMRRELDVEPHLTYTDDLRALYKDRVPGGADLVAYWFEKGRSMMEAGQAKRVGLLATQGIRGETNRVVLERIKSTGKIFWAHADREWILDGAMVHVSMIAFDNGDETEATLDGENVAEISAALTTGTDLTKALTLKENGGLAFIADMKENSFDVTEDVATSILNAIGNPNGLPNSLVVKPFLNARDITLRSRGKWIIDFGEMDENEAALFEAPFEYLRVHEKQHRDGVRNPLERTRWWQHGRVARDMRAAINGLRKFVATPRHSKHRMFTWVASHVVPDSALVVFAREDEYFLGILHSRVHELWSRATGTQVRDAESGFRYTPETCFDTFPFPWPPGTEPSEAESPIVKAIADAARSLVTLRDNWLNPKPAPGEPPIPESDLKRRTLTNLYNQRPTWLDNAHRTLDEAVFAAYGWPSNLTTQQILANLLALNHQRAAAQPTENPAPKLVKPPI